MEQDYSYSIEINTPQERAFNYLADYYNMTALHPFVKDVRLVDPKGGIRRYEITDSIQMLWWRVNVYLNITITHEEYCSLIRNRTEAAFGTTTYGDLKVEKLTEGSCRVWSTGRVECSWLFRAKVLRDLGFAHTRMLNNLKRVL
jgi:hypothetical protein